MQHYFDHNATTPLCEPARRTWLEMESKHWHNPSSLYREAAEARQKLENCRERLAELLGGCDPECIVFTSGATEANNGLFRVFGDWGKTHARLTGDGLPSGRRDGRVLISAYEHPSVREPARKLCRALEVKMSELEEEIANGSVRLLSWMAANNENGVLFDWSQLARQSGLGRTIGFFHSDAAQWLGKMPAAALACGNPILTASAHKFGGPKAVGFLRLPMPRQDFAWQLGGPQENGQRAGTENLPGIAAMIAALEHAESRLPGNPAPRDEFEARLEWPVVGGGQARLWNTSMVIAPRHDNRLWLARLSQRGFQCSTGSACSSGQDGDSHVLAAMGLDSHEMKRVLRFSSGFDAASEDWMALANALGEVQKSLDTRSVRAKAHA
ncbi:MAG: cysteine desulfurase family protein [Verrucomicrobiales bacterium]